MLRFVWVALAVASFAGAACAQGDGYAAAERRYKDCMTRLPLIMKYRGWEALVRTGEERALPILISDYGKAIEPSEQVQGMLASGFGRYFRGAECVEPLRALRLRHTDRRHAWLHFIVHELEAAHRGVADLRAAAANEKDPWVRSAALQALLEFDPMLTVEVATELMKKPPKAELERALLLETLIEGFAARPMIGDAAWEKALTTLVLQLDDKKLPKRTKIVLSRFLGQIFNTERRSIVSEPWLLQMKAGRNKTPTTDGYAPTFFDLRASGDRIAYVIDMSDSMLTPLPAEVIEQNRATGARPRAPGEKFDPFVDDYEIHWHKVQNRFDLAREQIKRSLYRLGEDKHFAVIGFGDAAKLLDGCAGMIPANRKNITRVVASLDAIRPGPRGPDRPNGTLWGKTNLHGGMLRAFLVTERGLASNHGGTDPEAFATGAETIYVLSDGDPTWDDWDQLDIDYKEDQYGDPESRTPTSGAPNMHYSGPYRDWALILEDVRRMNLLRNAEIHCISIGEVQFNRLEALAKLGHGRTKRFGN